MNQEFERLREQFLDNYKKACPIMTVLGDEAARNIFHINSNRWKGENGVGDIGNGAYISLCSFSPFENHVKCPGIISRRKKETKNYIM